MESLQAQTTAIADRHGHTLGSALATFTLGEAEAVRGNFAVALPRMAAGVDLVRRFRRNDWLAYLLNDLGEAISLSGDPERGMALSREGLALHRAQGNRSGAAVALCDLGTISLDSGEERAAAVHYQETLSLFAALGDEWYLTSPLAGLANIAAGMGKMEPAARLLGATQARRAASGAIFFANEATRFEQTMATVRGALGEERFAEVCAIGASLPLDAVIAEATAVAEARLRQPPAVAPREVAGPLLTERERQVLRLLCEGHADRAIAARLAISHRTVMHHVTSLLAKLGVESRTAAATKAVRLGLVEGDIPTPDR